MTAGSRWAKSDRTFGPAGRVVATVLALLPAAWFALHADPYGLVGLALWLSVFLPWALRDIWRRASRAGVQEMPHLSWPNAGEHGDIESRRGPSRW